MYHLSEKVWLCAEPVSFSVESPATEYIKVENISSIGNYDGFSQKVDVQTGDVQDAIISQEINKDNITINAIFRRKKNAEGKEENPYSAMRDFRHWITSHSDTETWRLLLVMGYGDGTGQHDNPIDTTPDSSSSANVFGRRREVIVESFGETAPLQNGSAITCPITFKTLSRPFTESYTSQSSTGSTGKTYNYVYPYRYSSTTQNMKVENNYFRQIPLDATFMFTGTVTNPMVALKKIGADEPYATLIIMDTFSSGDSVDILASSYTAYKTVNGVKTNEYNRIDKGATHCSFLFAKPGETQVSTSNSSSSEEYTFTIKYKEYDF